MLRPAVLLLAAATVEAAAHLEAAVIVIEQASTAIWATHTANGVVRWVGE